AGSSIGGLTAAYAGFAYNATFRRVAAMSPSYWWARRKLMGFAQQGGRGHLERYYQDMGPPEEAAIDTVRTGSDDLMADFWAMRSVAVGLGFNEGKDFFSVIALGQNDARRPLADRVPL